jgi:hypothetical protein
MKSWRGLWVFLFASAAAGAAPEAPLIGIDHMPLVVKNLEQATNDYRRLGFAIKPGRAHANGITNNHVKFPDGAGIELLTAPAARDDMTSDYVALLKQGEGPAYLGFHARDFKRFVATLDAAGIGHVVKDSLMQLKDPELGFLFFLGDNRAPNDRPEHFAHGNGAVAMTGVWIATADPARVVRVFTALGAVARKETVSVPEPVEATVLTVANGRVVLLPASRQLINGRPIVGAEFDVSGKEGKRDVFLAPAETHGLWLHFIRR